MRQNSLSTPAKRILIGGTALAIFILALGQLLILAQSPVGDDPAQTARLRLIDEAHQIPVEAVILSDRELPPVSANKATIALTQTEPLPLDPAPEPEEPLKPEEPVEPEPAPLQPQPERAAIGDLQISKSAATPAGNNQIYNGERITYTIVITNAGTDPITNLLILDRLPPDALTNIQCAGTCQQVLKAETINDPLAGTTVITTTEAITWFVAALSATQTMTKEFYGTVICQSDGAIIENEVFVDYWQSGLLQSEKSSAQTTARTQLDRGIGLGIWSGSVWCSAGLRGTYDLDWGDFDQDGDFDLAVASVAGTRVYRNDQGQLEPFWENDQQTFSVRWGDIIPYNNKLELAAVGDGTSAGVNYLYRPLDDSFEQVSAFASENVIFRLGAADYSGDGLPDLAAVNLNPSSFGCLVRLYQNSGSEDFTTGACALSPGNLISASSPYANALAWGDYDNDGYPDLAVVGAANANDSFVVVRKNSSGSLGAGTNISSLDLATGSGVQATGVAWGDYNSDGYLDLAVGFTKSGDNGEVRIYPNDLAGGFGTPLIRTTLSSDAPVAVAWGDVNNDGYLDLMVGDNPIRLYAGPALTAFAIPAPEITRGHIWAIRLADYNNNGALDLAFSNRDEPSSLFSLVAPFLNATLQPIHSDPASSVAWGDVDNDEFLDLLFGAGPSFFGSRLYYNDEGNLLGGGSVTFDGFGPRQVAFGDVNRDTKLDIGFGTTGRDEVYLNGSFDQSAWTASNANVSQAIAWGDVEGDGDLDLLTGGNGTNYVYLNQGTALSVSPAWSSSQTEDTRSVAWGDYNRDGYLDFAVGNYNQSSQIYCNNRDNTFIPVWTSTVMSTTGVTWADYDADGDLDLLLGNYDQANQLYQNSTCQSKTCLAAPFQIDEVTCQSSANAFSAAPVWASDELNKTTGLAWGDWDNDGDLDLAVGNDGERDQVYTNLGSQPGDPQLYLSWISDEFYQTTDIAWGDYDGDGDVDLAISQDGSDQSGVYVNTYINPSHLTDYFAPTMPLPHNPVYLSINQPGQTGTADFLSSAEILSGASNPTVTVVYHIFDPNGARDNSTENAPGQVMTATSFEFSLDGGGTWYTATSTTAAAPLATARQGQAMTFAWDAQADQAIGDNARFRITLISHLGPLDGGTTLPAYQAGWPLRATVSAVSPPFRVGGLSCVWPEGASIRVEPQYPKVNEDVRFEAQLTGGSGFIDYVWDFGDDSAQAYGPVVYHAYTINNTYIVKVTVRSEPCPIAREIVATIAVAVGTGQPDIYLPIMFK